jgi:hypothetical protein
MILVAAAVAAVFAGTAIAEGLRVAVIDVNKILNESEAGRRRRRWRPGTGAEENDRFEAGEARKIKEEIDKQKVMVARKSSEKEDALQAKVNELRQLTQERRRCRPGRPSSPASAEVGRGRSTPSKADKLDLVLEVVRVITTTLPWTSRSGSLDTSKRGSKGRQKSRIREEGADGGK